jgi:transposase InsO family protein
MALDEENGLWYFQGTRQPQGRAQCISALTHTNTKKSKVDDKHKNNNNTVCPYNTSHVSHKHKLAMDINEAHQRLGHVGESVLRSTMRTHNITLTGTMIPCDACMLYKATQRPTRKITSITAQHPGDRMYVDTSGPFPRTLGGNHYWVKFCDQFSGMSWNIFIKERSMVFQVVKTKILQMKGQGIKINHMRLDNAGEHSDFVDLCLKLGIQPELTAPHTPQHNGIVERRFATDLRRAQAMMEAADLTVGLRNLLRGEAIHTATFIGNMCVSPRNMHDTTPYEKFYKKKPQLQPVDLIQFGRIGYVTKRDKFQSKYKPKAYKCLFMGYSPYHSINTYRLYNPMTRKVILSRDVKWSPWNTADPQQSLRHHNNIYMKELISDTKWDPQQTAKFHKLLDHYIPPDTRFTAVRDIADAYNNGSVTLYDSDDDVWGTPLSHSGTLPHRTHPRNQEETIVPNASIDDNSTNQDENDGIEALDEDNFDNNETTEEQESEDNASNSTEEDRIYGINENNEIENFDFPDLEDINEEQDETKPKAKHSRELKNLGVIPKGTVPKQVQKLNTSYNPTFTEQINMAIASDPGEPSTMKEALNGPEKEKWKEAVKKEINNFLQRGVWKKVSREDTIVNQKRKLITTKWVFKKKIEQDNSIRYKARCVSRGFMQIPGVDYTESFSPVATDSSIRLMIGLYLYFNKHNKVKNWKLEMFDVEAAFLNAELDKPVFIEWPQGMEELGFINQEDKTKSCIQLTKAMYGNIDSPLRWMKTFTKFLTTELQLKQSKTDPCILYKYKGNDLVLVLALYVDDTLCLGHARELQWLYESIETKFKIERLGQLKKHLGIWYEWKEENGETVIEASMPQLINEIVKLYENTSGKPAKNFSTPGAPGKTLMKHQGEPKDLDQYRSLVGKIMYLTTKLAPELSNASRELASHLSNPNESHWQALGRCVGYLKHTKFNKLKYRAPRELRSISLCDSDYAKDENDRKSISGRINTVGGTITNWTSKKQSTVALSSTEAEYHSLSECAQESIFTQNLIKELLNLSLTAIIYEDNLGAIYLTKNQQVSSRTKHIDVRHHFLRDLWQDKRIDIRFVRSENNSSDIMTKNTPASIHDQHTIMIKDGRLKCWKEDVVTDSSVIQFHERNNE